MGEAAYKLLVALLQSHLGVDAVQTTHINQSEEQIANLLCCACVVVTSHLNLNFGNLLLNLCPYILLLLPVESR